MWVVVTTCKSLVESDYCAENYAVKKPLLLSKIVTIVAHGRQLCSPSFSSMAYLSDQRCSHHGKAANAFVTMGWSAAPFMLSGLALEEVGMNPIMQRSLGKDGSDTTA